MNIRELVDGVIKPFRQEKAASKVDFQFDIENGLTYQTDSWVLSILLEHLVDNAVVFSAEKNRPRVRIGARMKGETLELSVEDNGIGMTDEVKNQATKMFYRGSNRSTGNGLGLYNVQLAVDLLEGELHFEGTPGGGTTVRVTLA